MHNKLIAFVKHFIVTLAEWRHNCCLSELQNGCVCASMQVCVCGISVGERCDGAKITTCNMAHKLARGVAKCSEGDLHCVVGSMKNLPTIMKRFYTFMNIDRKFAFIAWFRFHVNSDLL